jgi:hypothetical protein
VTFDSPLLRHRIANTVYLPDDYRSAGARMPVMYTLHGTVFAQLDNCATNPITEKDTLFRMVGCGGGYLQDQLFDIPSQLPAMHFVVVSPDTDPNHSICHTCFWVNGRPDVVPNADPLTASHIAADSFLHQELYPLMERLFNLRSDRGGRGVMGFSMGAWAAALQGMIHPDDYSYIGWISGGYDIKEPTLASEIIEPVGYFRDQGYGTQWTDPVWWTQYNPKDIATNIAGVDTTLLLTSGDACVYPDEPRSTKYCRGRFSPTSTPGGVWVESELAYNRMLAVPDLDAKGIAYRTVHTPGTHGANNADMFAQYVVPQANARFAGHTVPPRTFSYRSAIPDFSVWGFRVTVTRGADALLNLTDVAADGRRMTLQGPGSVVITTPASFRPGRWYPVHTTHAGSTTDGRAVADRAGRLSLMVAGDDAPTTVTVG